MSTSWPAYDFKTHKGYITATHAAALAEHGPSPVHRMRFVNVRRAAGLEPPADDAVDGFAAALESDEMVASGRGVEMGADMGESR